MTENRPNRRPIWDCKHCGEHCTTRTKNKKDRPMFCLFGPRPALWIRRDGENKEKIVKDWPRECMCGGEFVEIFRARRGEEARNYIECKICKRVIE